MISRGPFQPQLFCGSSQLFLINMLQILFSRTQRDSVFWFVSVPLINPVSRRCFWTDSCGFIFEFQWWILARYLPDSTGQVSCSRLWQECILKLSILSLWFTVKFYDSVHIITQGNGRGSGHFPMTLGLYLYDIHHFPVLDSQNK